MSAPAVARLRSLSGVEVSWTAATRILATLRGSAGHQNGARQGSPAHVSTTAPSGVRNSDFWSCAAGVARGRLCGSSPKSGSVGGTLPSGGAGRPAVPVDDRRAVPRERGIGRMPQNGTTSGLRPGGERGLEDPRADRAGLDVGGRRSRPGGRRTPRAAAPGAAACPGTGRRSCARRSRSPRTGPTASGAAGSR